MKPLSDNKSCRDHRGMTLVEMIVAVGVGSLLLAALGMLFVSSLSNFKGLGNYAELTNQSRLSLDRMSREMRECTAVTSASTNLTTTRLELTNALAGTTIAYVWDRTTGVITRQVGTQNPQVYLTGCDDWQYSLYQRTPKNSWGFFPTSDHRLAKLINMSWKCSRQVVGSQINTETVVTSQVVLRNKP